MVEAWPHVQLFHGEGVVSVVLVDSFIRKEKKSKTFDFFWFWAPMTEEERKRQRSCKDQFRLRSNTGMDPGPRSPNNEFVECGKKS